MAKAKTQKELHKTPTANRVKGVPKEITQKPEVKPTIKPHTKQAILIKLLENPKGATVTEMAQAVGWQRHSVHGMIHGALRTKLGMQVTSQKEQRGRVYRIA